MVTVALMNAVVAASLGWTHGWAGVVYAGVAVLAQATGYAVYRRHRRGAH